MAEFLLEIGCEEIPAPWLPSLGEQLRTRFAELAAKLPLPVSNPRTLWTPRRLVLVAELPARQEDREETIFGPAQTAAKDANGEWTNAAKGFARKVGRAPEELHAAPRPGSGEALHLAYTRTVEGRAAVELLPGLIAQALRALAFAKKMSWDAWLEDGKGAFPFGRPIRWILALLDGEVVPFTIYALENGARGMERVTSGGVSFGHRFLPRGEAGKPLAARSYAELEAKLLEHFVVLDPNDRADRIRQGLGSPVSGQDELLEEWRDLVEHPAVVFGEIPAEFRTLPREVLETVLVHHQKYLARPDRDRP